MRYRLKKNAISENSFCYIDSYLRSLGINCPDRFIKGPKTEDEESPWDLTNMNKGLAMLNKHLSNPNSNIYIIVDSDADGYTSSSIIYNFILNFTNKVDYYIHEGKEHGVIPNRVPFGTDLVIIPDAGSNQIEELQELADRNMDVLVLDHHLVDNLIQNERVIIINNQTSKEFTNKNLSGAGVTFKFVQAYCKTYNIYLKPYMYYDLAAVGILSDMMFAGDLDNNYIIRTGLSHLTNDLLKAMLKKQSFSVSNPDNPNMIDIAFYISPLINAVIRSGSQEEKQNLFFAMANNGIIETFTHTYRGTSKEETLYEKTARECGNIHSRQAGLIEKAMIKLTEDVNKNQLDNKMIICITSEKEILKTLTGLAAMKLVATYNKPSLVLRPVIENNTLYYRGSGRGINGNVDFPSLKNFLDESNLCEYASGHDNAMGVSIKAENLQSMISYANEKLRDIDFDNSCTEVDMIFNHTINLNILSQIADNKNIFGNGIIEPKFAFEIVVCNKDISFIGKNKDTIKISYNGINFIKFKSKKLKEELEQVMNNDLIHLSIIGTTNWNVFNGRSTLQIQITDMEAKTIDINKLL